jgi:hypothetical protein
MYKHFKGHDARPGGAGGCRLLLSLYKFKAKNCTKILKNIQNKKNKTKVNKSISMKI